MSSAKQTTDHDTIRHWADARGGTPATVKATAGAHEAGILRIQFDDAEEKLEGISWDAFFEKFEQNRLAFLYQDQLENGQKSRFFKLIKRK